jgi:lipopolysaccharide biosynthesis glycosyltransferase
MNSIWIGFDPREAAAFAVARLTAERMRALPCPVNSIVLDDMRARGLYSRPTSRKDGRLWDDISDAPMSTEFAISRFLTPILAKEGHALFMDADMLVRAPLAPLFDYARAHPEFAVLCVKHNFAPPEGLKMDGQIQTAYARKNWSSVMVFNVDHPGNKRLTVDLINTVPGRDLHRLCWLADHEIGTLPAEWNYLVGHSHIDEEPKIVHFTDGIPSMAGYENVEFANEWRTALHDWANYGG